MVKLLGVSRAMVFKLENSGSLRLAGTEEDGTHLFRREDVAELAKRRGKSAKEKAGDHVAAKVFEMFEGGATLPEVVMQLQIAPSAVRSLYREYKTPLQGPAGSMPGLASTKAAAYSEDELAAAAEFLTRLKGAANG